MLSRPERKKGKTKVEVKGRERARSREKRGEGEKPSLFWCRARAIWQNDLLLWYLSCRGSWNEDGRFTGAEVGSLINGRRDKPHRFPDRYRRIRRKPCRQPCKKRRDFAFNLIPDSFASTVHLSETGKSCGYFPPRHVTSLDEENLPRDLFCSKSCSFVDASSASGVSAVRSRHVTRNCLVAAGWSDDWMTLSGSIAPHTRTGSTGEPRVSPIIAPRPGPTLLANRNALKVCTTAESPPLAWRGEI